MKNLYLDIHVIQTVPPSCVNRDDTGSPKTAVYGGVTRARVSSQAWKKAMREMFAEEYKGVRTKKVIDMITKEIENFGGLDARKKAEDILVTSGLKIKDGLTSALFFISDTQIKALAQLAVDGCKDKKTAQAALKANPSVDIALFGRMVADDPTLNTDASAQVAHSISTHKVSNEYDYFTAVDDCSPEDNAGAGMIGTVEFNSSTLYRYATVAIHELHKQLGENPEDTAEAAAVFTDAFIRSMPTGKQNTFANRTLPDAVIVTLRDDQPVNLVGAFERPVRSSEYGYVDASISALIEHAENTYKNWLKAPEIMLKSGKIEGAIPLDDLLNKLSSEVGGKL